MGLLKLSSFFVMLVTLKFYFRDKTLVELF